MEQNKKKFIVINEAFTCQKCGYNVEPLKSSCRNHCPKCLYSLHVDKNTPGDRESDCHGLMEPIGLDHKGKKGWQIVHKCTKCGKKQLNITAADDEGEEIRKIQLSITIDPS